MSTPAAGISFAMQYFQPLTHGSFEVPKQLGTQEGKKLFIWHPVSSVKGFLFTFAGGRRLKWTFL